MTVLTRAYAATLELRDDGRTLVGIAVPYGQETRIGRYVESFAPGAFADAGTHTLTAAHPRDGAELPIGHSVELRDQADGLHGAWHVSDTDVGNHVLTLVRDGVPLGLSIGFIPDRETWSRDKTRVTRLSATLDHVAVVRQPRVRGSPDRGCTGRTRAVRATPTHRPTEDGMIMATYELPEHQTLKGDDTVVLVFTEPLDADRERLVHRHLRAIHRGAGIATTGANRVTVTLAPRTAKAKKST